MGREKKSMHCSIYCSRTCTCPLKRQNCSQNGIKHLPLLQKIRLKFINSGPCGLPQNTGYLHFYKGEVTARNNVYSCSVRDDRCPETSKNSPIRAVWGGGHRFNLNLTKAYATVDDEALYTVSLHLHYRGESMEQIN